MALWRRSSPGHRSARTAASSPSSAMPIRSKRRSSTAAACLSTFQAPPPAALSHTPAEGALSVTSSNGTGPTISAEGLVVFNSPLNLAPGAPGDHSEVFLTDLHIRDGAAGNPIPLTIPLPQVMESLALDPDATLTITISGIPADAVVSHGDGVALAVTNGTLTVSGTANALPKLAITPGVADQPGFTLHVTATVTDGTDSASASEDLHVEVGPPRTLSGVEDHVIALPALGVAYFESGESSFLYIGETRSVTFSGLPNDAVLIVTDGQAETRYTPTSGKVIFSVEHVVNGNELAIQQLEHLAHQLD